MHIKPSKVTAIHLFSGGLDSILAAKLLQQQGIQVKCINFVTPFYGISDPEAIGEKYGLNIRTIDIFKEFLSVLLSPVYGYGKNMNPCVDCHAFMMKKAYEIALLHMPAFVSTGEVLEQRPKSQSIAGLNSVLKLSNLKGMVVRPLCQKLLAETEPEKKGWVDREQLLDISGRGRKRQIHLAEQFGITDYPTPAGGCILTDPGFSKRLAELVDFYKRSRSDISEKEIDLLKYGRHFRAGKCKIIIGRDNEDNMNILAAVSEEDRVFRVFSGTGPIGLILGEHSEKNRNIAAFLVKRYSRYRQQKDMKIKDSFDDIYTDKDMDQVSSDDYKMI